MLSLVGIVYGPALAAEVSVATIVAMLQVIYKRFPRRLLPKLLCIIFASRSTGVLSISLLAFRLSLRANLCELGDKIDANSKHVSRTFWRWLEKQEWRRMLPEPRQRLANDIV